MAEPPVSGDTPAAASAVPPRPDGRSPPSLSGTGWLPAPPSPRCARPGVTGLFARPVGPGPFPGVVAFGGSAGGLVNSAAWAPVLASRGLATLAIAYFAAPGLPATLERIEVEVVERAARWLLDRDDVAAGRVAVLGHSRQGGGGTSRRPTCATVTAATSAPGSPESRSPPRAHRTRSRA